MKISIDTKEDSQEEIKKIIRLLQNLVGEEIMTNSPAVLQAEQSSPMGNIFGDIGAQAAPSMNLEPSAPSETQISAAEEQSQEAASADESTDALFAELFSEEEIKKMDSSKLKEEEEIEDIKAKKKKYQIEFY